MNRQHLNSVCAVVMAMAAGHAAWADQHPLSATVLEFADERTLFVADSDGGRIYALELPETPDETNLEDSRAYNITGLSARIAAALDAPASAISYDDLAVHPITKDAFIALGVQTDDGSAAAVVQVDHDGAVTVLDLAGLESSWVDLDNAADDGVTFWRDIPASTLAVTDLDYADGSLFVSGLTTASSPRPFAWFRFRSRSASSRARATPRTSPQASRCFTPRTVRMKRARRSAQ